MGDYFDPNRIGSSILGQVIVNSDPLVVCLDLATIPIKPTGAMEIGKMFEDLVEEEYSEIPIFSEKYFKSDISKIPEYKGERTDIKQVLEILDDLGNSHEFEKAYIRKADGELHGSHKQRHRCLDQIAGHEYRRPVPEPTWDKLQIMLKRFKNYPFKLSDQTHILPLRTWINDYMKVKFQVEYFWKHECGAECRAKYDMIWVWTVDGVAYAMPWDLKVTGNWQKFKQNWKSKYIWQSIHYLEGFFKWCAENGYEPYISKYGHRPMWYSIQESEYPQITHARALSKEELLDLTPAYDEAISAISKWIQEGRPVKGYMEQQIVNRWGKIDE